jgi:hypothetical protein
MKICEYIDEIIEEQGRRKDWVAERSGIKYKTFLDKLDKDTFTAYELVSLGKLLDIDLNDMKKVINKNDDIDETYNGNNWVGEYLVLGYNNFINRGINISGKISVGELKEIMETCKIKSKNNDETMFVEKIVNSEYRFDEADIMSFQKITDLQEITKITGKPLYIDFTINKDGILTNDKKLAINPSMCAIIDGSYEALICCYLDSKVDDEMINVDFSYNMEGLQIPANVDNKERYKRYALQKKVHNNELKNIFDIFDNFK